MTGRKDCHLTIKKTGIMAERKKKSNKTLVKSKYTEQEKEQIRQDIQPYLDEKGNLKPLGRGRTPKIIMEAQASGVIKRLQKERNPVGRPKGDEGRIAEFKAILMGTRGEAVIHKMIAAALEDGHPAQSACLKMCIDRLIPVSHFDKAKGAAEKPQININISSIEDTTKTISMDEVPSVEFTDIDEEEDDES